MKFGSLGVDTIGYDDGLSHVYLSDVLRVLHVFPAYSMLSHLGWQDGTTCRALCLINQIFDFKTGIGFNFALSFIKLTLLIARSNQALFCNQFGQRWRKIF